jgi:hypothetical protein
LNIIAHWQRLLAVQMLATVDFGMSITVAMNP